MPKLCRSCNHNAVVLVFPKSNCSINLMSTVLFSNKMAWAVAPTWARCQSKHLKDLWPAMDAIRLMTMMMTMKSVQ